MPLIQWIFMHGIDKKPLMSKVSSQLLTLNGWIVKKWLFSQRPEGGKTRVEHTLLLLQLLVSTIVRALESL